MGYSNIAAGQGRYLGTVRTTAASGTPARGGCTEDSFNGGSQNGGRRFLWNRYNRLSRPLGVRDAADSWTYTTATWRQANGAAGNKVEFVVGLIIDPVTATAKALTQVTANIRASAGVGIDSTNTNSAQLIGDVMSVAGANVGGSPLGVYAGYPGVGYHAVNWLEISGATGTTTWYGDDGLAYLQAGMNAEVMA